jgi:hypothetical protein
MFTLYHFTSKNEAGAILADGFVGDIWLSPDPSTVFGEQARSVLLEVAFDCPVEELEPHRREIREEQIDGVTEEPVAGGQVDTYTWYEVPAGVVNSRAKVRAVGAEERFRLMNE